MKRREKTNIAYSCVKILALPRSLQKAQNRSIQNYAVQAVSFTLCVENCIKSV
jgi:hypothetical protein